MNIDETASDEGRSAPPAKNSRWLQVSLLTILLLLAIVALIISHVQMSWQMEANNEAMVAMKAELTKLRKEVGYLEINDPTQVHVVSVTKREGLVWQWRVFIPEGKEFRAYVGTKHSAGGSVTSNLSLDPGESRIDMSVYRDHEGKWQGELSVKSGNRSTSATSPVHDDFIQWLKTSASYTGGISPGEGTKVYPPKATIKLLNKTAQSRNHVSKNPPSSGEKQSVQSAEINVWIAPRKKKD